MNVNISSVRLLILAVSVGQVQVLPGARWEQGSPTHLLSNVIVVHLSSGWQVRDLEGGRSGTAVSNRDSFGSTPARTCQIMVLLREELGISSQHLHFSV